MKRAATMFSVPWCIAFGGRIRSGYMETLGKTNIMKSIKTGI